MVLGWTQHNLNYFRKRKFQKQQKLFDDRRNKKLISDACDNITKLYVHVHIHYYKQTNYNNNKTKNIIQQTTDCKKQKHTHNNNKYT